MGTGYGSEGLLVFPGKAQINMKRGGDATVEPSPKRVASTQVADVAVEASAGVYTCVLAVPISPVPAAAIDVTLEHQTFSAQVQGDGNGTIFKIDIQYCSIHDTSA